MVDMQKGLPGVDQILGKSNGVPAAGDDDRPISLATLDVFTVGYADHGTAQLPVSKEKKKTVTLQKHGRKKKSLHVLAFPRVSKIR
jgi:hypothetical protein